MSWMRFCISSLEARSSRWVTVIWLSRSPMRPEADLRCFSCSCSLVSGLVHGPGHRNVGRRDARHRLGAQSDVEGSPRHRWNAQCDFERVARHRLMAQSGVGGSPRPTARELVLFLLQG